MAPGPSYTPSSSLDWDADLLSPTSQVDAVYIASPDAFHFEHALATLRAGKHTLVEKPVLVVDDDMTGSEGGFQQLIDAASGKACLLWDFSAVSILSFCGPRRTLRADRVGAKARCD